MSTTKARSATTRKNSLEVASDREGTSRPRLVTTSRKRKASPESPPDAPDAVTVMEDIRVRAYYLSLARNGFGADPVDDWLRAERELISGGHTATGG
jgi:hypothetical protein